MGAHKGSGLSFMCELLAGALTGTGCAGPGTPRRANGMLSIYLATEYFDSDDSFAATVREYVDFFKSARPAAANGEVLAPGEPEQRARAHRQAEGIPLPDGVWQSLVEAAEDAGMSQQRIDDAMAQVRGAAESGRRS